MCVSSCNWLVYNVLNNKFTCVLLFADRCVLWTPPSTFSRCKLYVKLWYKPVEPVTAPSATYRTRWICHFTMVELQETELLAYLFLFLLQRRTKCAAPDSNPQPQARVHTTGKALLPPHHSGVMVRTRLLVYLSFILRQQCTKCTAPDLNSQPQITISTTGKALLPPHHGGLVSRTRLLL